ncbi:hypothetical protein E2C01_046625 [Portunus trituberculatus]|uniref:Uncharacterized protein n=1 Tax=Portunus trituberculatus TaxID=210409 RepID=A0A5B7G5B1_PORTR|nr:hypothetical protein [Portunus trituberculatus]
MKKKKIDQNLKVRLGPGARPPCSSSAGLLSPLPAAHWLTSGLLTPPDDGDQMAAFSCCSDGDGVRCGCNE